MAPDDLLPGLPVIGENDREVLLLCFQQRRVHFSSCFWSTAFTAMRKRVEGTLGFSLIERR
ncbi:MAG: hypothetical protein R2818_02300 [Flavobacteriales bacterium]